jgi:hypothetical protein
MSAACYLLARFIAGREESKRPKDSQAGEGSAPIDVDQHFQAWFKLAPGFLP